MARNRTLEAIISIAGQLDPSLAQSISNAQKQFGGLKIGIAAVSTVAVAATAALVKFGADAVKSAAEFETQMANVATLLDGKEEQVSARISELGDDVLAVSNNTGVATDELTDGLYQIISAVGDSEDAVSQMELAAKAAAAGGAETTDAINLLTAVTKGYGDTSGEAFQKASDLSFMTVKLGQTSFPELASSIGKVIPMASALGVEQEELFGAFATLTGVSGSTAEVATQMKAVMVGLMSPTKDMTKALNSLGYSNANAALESLGFQGTLDALGETVDGDTQKLAKMFSSSEAQNAILYMAGDLTEDLTKKTAALYDATGATDAAFAKQTDTLEYTIQCIKNLGKNFMTSVGRTILPVVKDIAQKLLPVVQGGLERIQPVFESLYAALSPVISMVGDLILGLMPSFEKRLGMVWDLWEKMQPVLGEIAGQLMPILGTVLGELDGLFETIAPVISEFIESLLPILGEMLVALAPIIGTIVEALSPVFDMIGSLASSFLPALAGWIGILAKGFQAVAPFIESVVSVWLTRIVSVVQSIIGVFTGLCDFIANVFTGNWEALWGNVVSIFSNIIQGIGKTALLFISPMVDIINAIITGINSMGITIPDWVPGLGGKSFSLDIPTIQLPQLAAGGFTDGVSIAGEAGTEAVISFAHAYRNENLSYWARAGHMLGVDDSLLDTFESRNAGQGGITINVTFAPQITIDSTEKIEFDLMEKLREEEENLVDMLEDMLDRRGGDQYRANFG